MSTDVDNMPPLPEGWTMAKTPEGQRYFINHNDKTTTWEDPRRKILQQQLQQGVQQRLVILSAPNTAISLSNPSINLQNIGPMPAGWEQSVTPEGEIYFINHNDRTTSWYDPRIPANLQKPNALQQHAAQQSSQGMTTAPPQPPPFSTTPSSLVTALQNMNTSSNNSNANASNYNNAVRQQQGMQRLQELQLEREKMRQRQQEILRQTMLKNATSDEIPSGTARIQPVTTGIDPFLGETVDASINDGHSRQKSDDSGINLAPCYNLPDATDDFLANIDDHVNDDNNNQSRNADLGLETLHVSSLENMESDDLVPSLPDDFNADLLSNVEALLDTNRDNLMTWL